GGFLDELLVAALERAVARRDDDDVPVRVREALRLDVARLVEEAFDEALPSAEGRRRLTDRGLVELVDLVRLARDLEAAPTAAVGGLDRDRQAVLGSEGVHLGGVRDGVGGARDERGTRALRDVACAHLVPERLDRGRGRAD